MKLTIVPVSENFLQLKCKVILGLHLTNTYHTSVESTY